MEKKQKHSTAGTQGKEKKKKKNQVKDEIFRKDDSASSSQQTGLAMPDKSTVPAGQISDKANI